MLKKHFVRLLILPVLIKASFVAIGQPKPFPGIRPASVSIEISRSKPEVVNTLTIDDSLGDPAYEFSITAISTDNQTTKAIYLSLSTSGRYSPSSEEKYEPNLLNSDYWGHGEGPEVIHPEELCTANKDNPFYGSRREFRLRRMKITVEISDFALSEDFCPRNKCGEQMGGLVKAKISVNVQPDDSRRKRPVSRPYEIKPCNK